MTCREAADLIRDYLDRELDAERGAAVEGHCATCPECARRLEAERELKQLLRAHARPESAPAALPAQLARALRAEAVSGGRLRRWLPAAALILLALGLGLAKRAGLWERSGEATPPEAMLAELVGGHLCCISHGPADPDQQIATANPGQAEGWLAARLGFDPALPRFVDRDMRLLGARLCRVGGRAAALVAYDLGDRRCSLFVLDAAGLALPAMAPLGERRFPCAADAYGRFRAICWRRGRLLYALVADEEQGPMVELVAQAYRP